MPTPTVRRLLLGHELRHLREEAECSLEEAAEAIRRTDSTISRVELGQTGLTKRDLHALVSFYASQNNRRTVDVDWYMDQAKGSQQRGRWSGYRSVYAKFFRMAVDLEEDAAGINNYATEILPGLLQIEDYIRALFTTQRVRTVDQSIEDAVRARLDRQRVVKKRDAPQLGFVLSESAVRRTIGDEQIMRLQLEHLADVAALPNVQLQVLPFDARTPAQVNFNFTTYRVDSPGNSGPLEFVYIEEFHDGKYVDDQRVVNDYYELWTALVGAALDPVESRAFLSELAKS
ncbi:helix-turn-helix domain-containing protein [Saccharopolyspora sp. 5N708]|uniref:helix-turn-helix domain-containing protein n=1 Tax=Saccharopolyspora sp. 5N708 TaxID=3457424 RepID=UPI003FD3D6E2